MRDNEDSALEDVDRGNDFMDGFFIEVVRRLVENEDIDAADGKGSEEQAGSGPRVQLGNGRVDLVDGETVGDDTRASSEAG